MLLFVLVVAALAILAYYVFGRDASTDPEGTQEPVPRESSPEREPETTERGPKIHAKKVVDKTKNDLRTARKRVQRTEKKSDLKEIARESYILSESLRKMFSSDQFFREEKRFDSFRTAIKAAEHARDRLIDRQKKSIHQTDVLDASASDYVGDKYVRNATESALMIMWCAGGLIGKGRYESAREVFHVSVSREDVRSWERFGQVLQKESAHYLIDPPSST